MFGWLKPSKDFEEISAQEVANRLAKGEKLQIIDVREPNEFAAGHIPGAKLIPLGHLAQYFSQLDPEQEYIMVCRSGNRSGTACSMMSRVGFKKALNMAGGMLAWKGQVER